MKMVLRNAEGMYFVTDLTRAARFTGSHLHDYDAFLSSRGEFVIVSEREIFCSSYKNLSCVTTLVYLIV